LAAQKLTQLSAVFAMIMSVCPSVRLSVTLVNHAKMVQDIEIGLCFTSYHRKTSLVS